MFKFLIIGAFVTVAFATDNIITPPGDEREPTSFALNEANGRHFACIRPKGGDVCSCTGFLFGEHLVATAAECLYDLVADAYYDKDDMEVITNLQLNVGSSLSDGRVVSFISKMRINVNYKNKVDDNDKAKFNYGVIILEDVLSNNTLLTDCVGNGAGHPECGWFGQFTHTTGGNWPSGLQENLTIFHYPQSKVTDNGVVNLTAPALYYDEYIEFTGVQALLANTTSAYGPGQAGGVVCIWLEDAGAFGDIYMPTGFMSSRTWSDSNEIMRMTENRKNWLCNKAETLLPGSTGATSCNATWLDDMMN